MTRSHLTIPGHIPVKEAARRLHRSQKRVLQYIWAQRLPAQKVQGRYMIPLAALETFRPRPHGRVRTKPVLWQWYRTGAQVFLGLIEVPVVAGQQTALVTLLSSLPSRQQYLFPGTMQRFIGLDQHEPAQLYLILIWKTTDLPDESLLWRELESFQRNFAEVLDWAHARMFQVQTLAHT